MSTIAGDVLSADLEKRKASLGSRLFGLVDAVLSSDPSGLQPMDLVVRRLDNGQEVLRTKADLGDPQRLLDTVRDDLATKTVEQFHDEWRLRDAPAVE